MDFLFVGCSVYDGRISECGFMLSFNGNSICRKYGSRHSELRNSEKNRISCCLEEFSRRSVLFSGILAGFHKIQKQAFASAMNFDMDEYESFMYERKKKLFEAYLQECSIVLDVGIGTGPNLIFMPRSVQRVVGVDPNEFMFPFTFESARKVRENGGFKGDLQLLNGNAESLPLDHASVDAAITTLVLCSVADPSKALIEIARVVRPGGFLVFVEHVLADRESYPLLRISQQLLNPLQKTVADGCHLTRNTEQIISNSRHWTLVSIDRLKLPSDIAWLISPQILGAARRVN